MTTPDPLREEFERDDIEAVISCLEDDAAQLRENNDEDERAANMDRAASMLTVFLLRTARASAPAAPPPTDFDEYELRYMNSNPAALALLMDYHDAQQDQSDSMGGETTGDAIRVQQLKERGRSIMVADLDVWDDELRRQFGFPPYRAVAAPPPMAAGQGEPRKWHELKTDPAVFDDVAAGRKTYELRKDDRGFKVGDGVILRRTRNTGWAMANTAAPLEYTGDEQRRIIGHILAGPIYGLAEGWAVLSFAALSAAPSANQGVTQPSVDSATRSGPHELPAGVAVGCAQEPLLPCPFCGCEDSANFVHGGAHVRLCEDCGAEGPVSENVAGAARRWNRRAASPNLGVEGGERELRVLFEQIEYAVLRKANTGNSDRLIEAKDALRAALAGAAVAHAPQSRWKCSNKDCGQETADYGRGRCELCDSKGLHWSLYAIATRTGEAAQAAAAPVEGVLRMALEASKVSLIPLDLAIDALDKIPPTGADWPVNWPVVVHGLRELRTSLSKVAA